MTLEWISWLDLPATARAPIKAAAERVMSDCKEGIEESFKLIAHALVQHGKDLRDHLTEIAALSARASQERDPDRMREMVVELGKIARAALSRGAAFDLPKQHPVLGQGLGKLFFDALTKTSPMSFLRERP